MAYVPPASSGAAIQAKNKPIVYFVGFTAALAGLLFGLDIGVISGAEQFIQADFKISDADISAIVSALLWGAVLGTFISGYFAKSLGRRKTILLSAVLFVLGSIACAFAPNHHVLILARFFLGIAVGMASFTAPLYLSEVAPQNIRGAMISMYQLMITVGIVVAFGSNTYFAEYAVIDGQTGGHWRWMLGIIVIPAAIMFAGVYFLPESPRWLVLKGFRDQAVKVLQMLMHGDEAVAREIADIEEGLKVKQQGLGLFMANKFFRNAVFLGVGLQVIQQLTGINVIMYYAPRVLGEAGFSSVSQQLWGTVIIGITNVLATFIAIAFVDKLGRKPIMYAGFITMGVAMVTVGIIFNSGSDRSSALDLAAMVSLLIFIVGFAMSAGPIIWILCSEIYPLAARDFGVTCSTATNWIVNAIVGATFLQLMSGIGAGNTFLLYGGMNILFIIYFLLFVPETKGVSLEKIESNLLSGIPLRKIGR